VRPAQPIGRFDEKAGEWILTERWECRLSGGKTLLVRPGFASDGASIPRRLWNVVGPPYAPKTFPAAVAHDALYCAELLPRLDADAEFRRLLILTGVSYLKASAYYHAVAWCGWIVWRRHTAISIAEAREFAYLLP